MKDNDVKLAIMSDGTVALNGIRITRQKMYGVQSVKESYTVSREDILKALEVSEERSNHERSV